MRTEFWHPTRRPAADQASIELRSYLPLFVEHLGDLLARGAVAGFTAGLVPTGEYGLCDDSGKAGRRAADGHLDHQWFDVLIHGAFGLLLVPFFIGGLQLLAPRTRAN